MSFLRKALPETGNNYHESSRDRVILFLFLGVFANNSRMVPGRALNGPLNRLARLVNKNTERPIKLEFKINNE